MTLTEDEKFAVSTSLVEIFGDNPYYAISKENSNGDHVYYPVEGQMTQANMLEHLNGQVTLGAYQLIVGFNTVRWLGWDVDGPSPDLVREQTCKILSHLQGIPHVVEFSGRKGYHVLIFLSEPMLAVEAKKITETIRDYEKLPVTGKIHVECYPKQDKLNKSKPKGNLLKIPLGEHPVSHNWSVFVDPDNGWEDGDWLDPIASLSMRATVSDLRTLIGDTNADPMAMLAQLIAPYWVEGQRHEVSLYLAGFLINEGWGVEQVKDIIRLICGIANDEQVENRLESVETTYIRSKEGKTVRGRQGLGEIMPVAAMQRMTELIAVIKTPDTVAQIDAIRYSKGKPVLESARLASNTMWSILTDDGCDLVQTIDREAFWYNAETHELIREGTEIWKAILNKMFGLNPLDGFSRLTAQELRLRIVRDARVVEVYDRTAWDENTQRLFVNLGGPEVYIANGNTIETAFNGECGKLFRTNEAGRFIVPDFECQPVDFWEFTVNDLSFKTSSDASAKPEEQREMMKAWIMAFFFQEIMPTKPILAMLGVPGSGKTTAMRRILKILEDNDTDVLSVQGDKQDSLRTSISFHRLLVLDNLEKSGVWWLVDMLNRLATGSNIELRELYKTNERHIIIPKCFVACTAVSMPFSDETLFTRLLVLEMQQLTQPAPEHILQKRIFDNASRLWADLIRKLNLIVRAIRENRTVRVSSKSRLADFTMFCERIKNSGVVDGSLLISGIGNLADAQLKQLKESSQAITLLEDWIHMRPQEASKWHTIQELFIILQTMASARRIQFRWTNATALSRHLDALKATLKVDLNADLDFGDDLLGGDKQAKRFKFKTFMVDLGPSASTNEPCKDVLMSNVNGTSMFSFDRA